MSLETSNTFPAWFRDEQSCNGVYLFNPELIDLVRSPETYTRMSQAGNPAQAFISAIYEDVELGYGFVPFIGAGFSVTAGIPMIRHLLIYLQRCICMVLGIDIKSSGSNHPAPRWNPRTDNWPPFIDRSRATGAGHWEKLVRDVYAYEVSHGHENDYWLYEHALGAMREWRTALEFLSHIEIVGDRAEKTSAQGPVRFCEPDRGIIDACFREVMRDKHPSMNHNMLAALSTALRIDLILTTNFDNLTEAAFEQYRNPLTAFDVHLGETLPDVASVSRTRSILKLHGSLRSLRADFSLEGLPTAEDRRVFADYLCDHPSSTTDFDEPVAALGTDPHSSAGRPSNRRQAARHLLMLGVAAREKRTVAFVKHALRTLNNLKVYWVCYTEDDIRTVGKEFAGTHLDDKERPRIYILRNTNVGLLFLHLYQMIRKSLPSSGTIFPSPTRLSIPPLPWLNGSFENSPDFLRYKTELSRRVSVEGSDYHRLVCTASDSEAYGLATAAAQIFRDLETSHNCIWLDMNDIHDADALFEAFRESAFHRLHDADWTPLFQIAKQRETSQSQGHPSPLVSEIVRIINSSNQPWVFFINAREIPGSNRSLTLQKDAPNGWMDQAGTESIPRAASAEAFRNLLQAFVNATSNAHDNKIVTVILCFSNHDGKSHLLNTLESSDWGENPNAFCVSPPLTSGVTGYTTPEVLANVVGWTSKGNSDPERVARRHFVQTLVSMQRPRHFSVAWAKCVNNEWLLRSGFDASRLAWLEELERYQIVRRMDGGFIWLQTSFRQCLRQLLALTPADIQHKSNAMLALSNEWSLSDETLRALQEWNAPAHQADIHLSLSTWYRKVLDATGTAAAVFEIVDHLCWAAESLFRFGRDNQAEKLAPGLETAELTCTYVETARQLLAEHQFLIQTQGHPEATLRRLEFIRDLWVSSTLGDTKKSFRDNVLSLGVMDEAWITSRTFGNLPDEGSQHAHEDQKKLEELLRSIAKLQCTAAECAALVNREVAEDGDAFANIREYGLRMVRNIPLTKNEVDKQLTNLKISLHEEISRVFSEELNQRKETDDLQHLKDRRYEWINWWRCCAMLGNASRSFVPASDSISRAITAGLRTTGQDEFSCAKPHSLTSFPDTEDFKNLARIIPAPLSANEPRHQLQALHSMEVAAFNLTLRAHTAKRAFVLAISTNDDPETLNTAAFDFATKGLELVEAIQNSGISLSDYDHHLHWLKARLLMIAGIASVSTYRSAKHSRHAMTFLGDAAACLNSTMPERANADLAIVELRRGEISLSEAASHPLGKDHRSFERWINQQLEGSVASNLEELERIKGGIASCDLRIIRALLADALHFLERAEPILKGRRRNVFWTTWYFERRLRAISLVLWVSALEGDLTTPIPYVGLEAAMYGTETEPDRLLLDALRMIRVDAFRMSMVVMAYASCARALDIRMHQAKEREQEVSSAASFTEVDGGRSRSQAADLQNRLFNMYKNLEFGRKEIELAMASRNARTWEGLSEKSVESAKLNEVTAAIIKNVLDSLKRIIPRIVTA